MDFLNPERVLVARNDCICYIQGLSKRHSSLALFFLGFFPVTNVFHGSSSLYYMIL